MIVRFDALARIGDKLKVNEERSRNYKPLHKNQLSITFNLLYSNLSNPKLPNQVDVKPLGKLTVKLPLKSFGTIDREIEFSLKFAEEELKVTARNKKTDESYHANFKYPDESV